MNKINNFVQDLDTGIKFEDYLFSWLRTNLPDLALHDCRNEKKYAGGGPKIWINNKAYATPDFNLRLLDSKKDIWIDAKYKKQTFYLKEYESRCVSSDTRSYNDYIEFINLYLNRDDDFWVIFGIEETKKLYLLDIKKYIEQEEPIMFYFNNGYNRYNKKTPCFKLSLLTIIGDYS